MNLGTLGITNTDVALDYVKNSNTTFQKLVKSCGLGQSMSRRGNCWDNAQQESFFGHFKGEAYIKLCKTLE